MLLSLPSTAGVELVSTALNSVCIQRHQIHVRAKEKNKNEVMVHKFVFSFWTWYWTIWTLKLNYVRSFVGGKKITIWWICSQLRHLKCDPDDTLLFVRCQKPKSLENTGLILNIVFYFKSFFYIIHCVKIFILKVTNLSCWINLLEKYNISFWSSRMEV